MISRPPPACPLCHRVLGPQRELEDHLIDRHTERELAGAIVAEFEVLLGADAS